ncbi:hypothetical protein PENTCL1PPCAC_4824, partial [Pristionchus entomophagus]
TTEDEEESSDDEDTATNSKQVLVTDYVSSDLIKGTIIDCGRFIAHHREGQKRKVRTWNYACDVSY